MAIRAHAAAWLIVFAGLVPAALAQTAGMMSFQALIKDGSGTPLDGPQDLLFEIVDGAVPTPNVLAFFTRTGVPAKQGVVSTKYGPVSPSLFDGGPALYLRVTVTSQAPDLVLAPIEIVTPPAVAERLYIPGTSSPAVVVNGSGQVGIGTTSPIGKVDVWTDSGSIAAYAKNTRESGVNYALSADATGPNATSNTAGYFAARGAATNYAIYIEAGFPDLGEGNFAIHSASQAKSYFQGNVGIGTTVPARKLHVVGDSALEGSLAIGTGIGAVIPETQLFVRDLTTVSTFTGNNAAGVRIDGVPVNGSYSLLSFDAGTSRAIAQIGCLRQSFGSSLVFGTSNDYVTGVTNRAMVIDEHGHVGIGVTAPTFTGLHVGYGNAGGPVAVFRNDHQAGFGVRLESNNDSLWLLRLAGVGDVDRHMFYGSGAAHLALGGAFVGIGTTSPSEKLTVTGNICATGTIGACSDARFKTNVTPLDGALATLGALRPVRFDWRCDEFPDRQFDNKPQIGFIAQELFGALPEVVQQNSDGYYSVDYGRLTPVLTGAIKELNENQRGDAAALRAENVALRTQVETQQQTIDELSKRLDRIERLLAGRTGVKED